MKLLFSGLVTSSLVTVPSAQNGTVEILSHKEDVFVNTDCKKNKTCELKKVEYLVEDYSVGIDDGHNYGTRFFARYETKKIKDLEKYVFVQFIKGCDFSSSLVNGQPAVEQDVSYPRDAGPIKFLFKEWTIDSYDFDPVYSTVPGKSRFFGYRWNMIPGSFSTDTEKLYGQEKPKVPKMYIVDHPGSAFYLNGTAHNISLQFRTCIYRTKDVPRTVSHNDINFAKPIHCYEWTSSFVYNHSVGEFESPLSISSACQ
ncbi:MAG: hypothetical protein Q7S43_00560 [bacterium]|nr:hypothetical protein [bacterium]